MSNLVVYGARCIWWDSIDKVGQRKTLSAREITPRLAAHPLPCCPHCGNVLFQMDEADWWSGVDRYERNGHSGYRAFVEWWRGKCFPTLTAALAAYTEATGNAVEGKP